MRRVLPESSIPLIYSGEYREEFRRALLEQGRREILKEWAPGPPLSLSEQVSSRPHVYAVGPDEIRVTVPALKRVSRGARPKVSQVAEGDPDGKRADNVGRAMRTVYDVIKCNPWTYFCTQTVSKELLDRTNLHALVKTMSRGVADQNKRVIHESTKIRYLWVPELHADGETWHLHGVMSGLTERDLRRNENGFFEWSWSADRVGFFSLSRIRSRERTASYIRKYITKNVGNGGQKINSHLYYCSKKLERPAHLASDDILHSAELCKWVKERAAFSKSGVWADVYTLQGAVAVEFRERWGDILEVVP